MQFKLVSARQCRQRYLEVLMTGAPVEHLTGPPVMAVTGWPQSMGQTVFTYAFYLWQDFLYPKSSNWGLLHSPPAIDLQARLQAAPRPVNS